MDNDVRYLVSRDTYYKLLILLSDRGSILQLREIYTISKNTESHRAVFIGTPMHHGLSVICDNYYIHDNLVTPANCGQVSWQELNKGQYSKKKRRSM